MNNTFFSINKNSLCVIISVMVFGLTYGLTAPLITVKLAGIAHAELIIGLNAAMQAVGVLAVSPFLPALFRCFRTLVLICSALLVITISLCLFPFTSLVIWFLLRFILGVCTEIIMVSTETWLSDESPGEIRGQTMALYTAFLSTGFAAGPLMLSVLGHSGGCAFFVGGAVAFITMCSLQRCGMRQHNHTEEAAVPFVTSLRLAWIAIAAAALNAAVEVMGMNFMSLYAIRMGWPAADANLLLSILLCGAIIFQLPIGWLADRVECRRLMIILALLSAAGALAWPFLLMLPWFAYGLIFIWGGVFVGIYTVAITWIGSLFKGAELAGIYAAMSVAWGAGALAGPILGGVAMHISRHGLSYLTAIFCLLFGCASGVWRERQAMRS